jgi:signal recognition particle subunit SEC65
MGKELKQVIPVNVDANKDATKGAFINTRTNSESILGQAKVNLKEEAVKKARELLRLDDKCLDEEDYPSEEEIEKVVECLQKLGKTSELMEEIFNHIEEVRYFALGGLHDSLTSKDSMMAVVYCLIKYEENPEMAKEIAETIGEASFYGYDASGVIKMAKLFSSDEVVKCLSKFTENLEELGNLVRKLNILLNYSRDGREVAMRAIDVISKKAKTAEEAFDIVEREFPNNV